MSELYSDRIKRAGTAIKNAEKLVIGAGAGLSAAAGIDYNGKRFTENFKPFIEKYGMKDLYTSSFYPFRTQEEKWAYWARHISINLFETPVKELYITVNGACSHQMITLSLLQTLKGSSQKLELKSSDFSKSRVTMAISSVQKVAMISCTIMNR